MKPEAPLYRDVLVFRAPFEAPGTARLGGSFLQPDYALAYLLAASRVIESAEATDRVAELAVPAAYLQRHAFELAVKSLIVSARWAKAYETWLEALKSDRSAPEPTPPRKDIENEHGLVKLVELLDKDLRARGYGAVPSEIVAMADRLTAVENKQHTRLRYPSQKGGAPSFPEEVTIRVGDTQTALEDLFERFFVYRHEDAENETLMTTLGREEMGLGQAAEARAAP